MEEPYRLDPDRIAGLTDAQIIGMYARERDPKTGVPKPVGVKGKREYRTPEENKSSFIGLMTAFGKSVAEAEAAWAKAATKGV